MSRTLDTEAPARTHQKGQSPLNENGLTLKQQAFVDAYVVTLNGTDAARQAGYTGDEGTLATIAWENLRKQEIVSLLRKRLQVISDKVEKKNIDVYAEFLEQLEFAKKLRLSADQYLTDVNDPLRLDITPRANEIEVTYLDHNDMEQISLGNKVIERPKKKKAMLNVILESLVDVGLHPEKFSVKTIDIRKFALDAINTADICIDKFARMGGAYQKDRANEQDPQKLMEDLVAFLVSKGHDRDVAMETARRKYATGSPLQLTS